MYLNLLRESSFFLLLQRIDEELAESVRCSGCPHCGGALHRAAYPRKPRGGPPLTEAATGAQLPELYDWRFSWCCGTDGCRRRATPPSVRFLGRRVYLGAVVVLLSALLNGVTPWRVTALQQHLPVSRRTLVRWREWWLSTFVETPLWRAMRGFWMPLVDESHLPGSLLARFAGDAWAQLVAGLRLLLPLTTRSCAMPALAGSPAW